MFIGRKIYYEKLTGNVIVNTGERSGSVIETTIEQDFELYAELAARVPTAVGVIQLEYGQYSEDFMQCNGYRTDLETGEIVFSYPDPNLPPEQPPVYQKPLTEQVADQEQRLSDIELALADIFTGGGE